MRKRSFRLILFVVAIAMCSCEEFDPWADVDHGPFPALPEMPEKVNNNNYIYVTHEATLSNRTVRNYSICFDKTKYAARWIAYPLHPCYRGSTDRSYQSSQVWPYDPLIVSSYQAVGKGGYNGYTRGHQIPSADRTATRELNEQTFYMSNMTPQAYDFNSGIWLDLENKVRSEKYMCNDTIYVVTGAHWENTNRYAGKYPIPTHYYKVLLRTRKGNTHKTVYQATRDELKCVGFWISHTATGSLNKSYLKSVDEIERLTGFTFFPEVDVDKTLCDTTAWGF